MEYNRGREGQVVLNEKGMEVDDQAIVKAIIDQLGGFVDEMIHNAEDNSEEYEQGDPVLGFWLDMMTSKMEEYPNGFTFTLGNRLVVVKVEIV